MYSCVLTVTTCLPAYQCIHCELLHVLAPLRAYYRAALRVGAGLHKCDPSRPCQACQHFSTSTWCWRAQLLAGPAVCETRKFSCSEKIEEKNKNTQQKLEKKEIQNQSDMTKLKPKDGGMAQDAVRSTRLSASFVEAHQDAKNDTTQRMLFRANLVGWSRLSLLWFVLFCLSGLPVSLASPSSFTSTLEKN